MEYVPLALKVQIAIALGTVILVPSVIFVLKHYLRQRRIARHAELCEHFATRDEIDKKHQENVALLDAIRSEGLTREGKILASIDALSSRNSQEVNDLRAGVRDVHQRVDTVLQMMGDRRRSR